MKYGLTQFIFRDIQALVRKGHEVELFTLRHNRGLYNPLPDWKVYRVEPLRLILGQLRLVFRKPGLYLRLLETALRTRLLHDFVIGASFAGRMQDADVIYAYFGDHKLFVGYYCKRISNVPLIVTIRAYELHNNPNPTMFVKALAYCDRVVTITEYNKAFLTEHFDVPADRIDIVRQIVDLDDYRFEPKLKILIVGFFAQKKGHEVLFKALKLLGRDDVEVWVVGDQAPDRRLVDCRRLARDLDIESQVAFFGEQEGNALKALYRECDVFCLPSRIDSSGDREGFPNAIIEAMAFGKPVISTRHAGIPEAIDDAALVDEDNVEQLVEALNRVCGSVRLRRELGIRNRRAAEEMFSMSNSDRLERILQRYATDAHRVLGVSLERRDDGAHSGAD
ncbi:MAG: colanic acid biosynthesis glycosyltransferase WcaL [Anaerolineales bacterium]|nr:MAG: colanic acid biosynthesis glycosyltransferase WcaL [Anaerolineales bacterium]